MKPATKMKLRIAYFRFMLFFIGFNLTLARRGYNHGAIFKFERAQRQFLTELNRLLHNQRSVQLANQFMRRLESKR